MANNKHTVESAIAALRRKRVKFGEDKDPITGARYSYLDLSGADRIGIGSLGLVDFLHHYHAFTVRR